MTATAHDSASQQLELNLTVTPLVRPARVKGATIQERFEAFHAANPWVYRVFVEITRDWIARGRPRMAVSTLTEVTRWQYGRQTEGDGFKINNSFRSRYVRLMIAEHPEWTGVFETRELKSP